MLVKRAEEKAVGLPGTSIVSITFSVWVSHMTKGLLVSETVMRFRIDGCAMRAYVRDFSYRLKGVEIKNRDPLGRPERATTNDDPSESG
jgi:hypothetical protein